MPTNDTISTTTMNHDYSDIRDLIPENPKWFDECAVPRYCRFSPHELSDIYADEAAFVMITCQGCGHEFKVGFSSSLISRAHAHVRHPLAEAIKEKSLHYGDPPNIGCCAPGVTMNSEPRRVIEYWQRISSDWQRDKSFEIDIRPDWVTKKDA